MSLTVSPRPGYRPMEGAKTKWNSKDWGTLPVGTVQVEKAPQTYTVRFPKAGANRFVTL